MIIDGNEVDKVPFGVIQIFFYCFFTLFLTSLVIMYYLRENLNKNWEDYRCKSYVMPFTSFVKPGTTYSENYKYCNKKKITPIFREHAKETLDVPLLESKKTQMRTKKEVEQSEKIASSIKDETKKEVSFFVKIYERLKNIGEYSMIKIQHFFMKIGAIIWTIYYQLITQINVILIQIASIYKSMALMNSLAFITLSIGTLLAFPPAAILSAVLFALLADINLANKAAEQRAYCCFDKFTMIKDNKNNSVFISQTNPGDLLKNNNKVLGIIVLKSMYNNIYTYELDQDLRVTGDHIIFNAKNNKWETVLNYIETTGYFKQEKNVDCIYSLVTESNELESSNYILKDYEETHDNKVQSHIGKVILNHLNENTKYRRFANINTKYELGERVNCLCPGTKILMHDKTYKSIEDIQINERLSKGYVKGYYKCIGKDIKWFEYNENLIGCKVICHDGNKWDKIYNVGKKSNIKFDYGYHLITSEHIIQLKNNVLVRDFIETDNINIQNRIYDLVNSHINN